MPETKAKRAVTQTTDTPTTDQQEEKDQEAAKEELVSEQPAPQKTLAQVLGEAIESTVRNARNFPEARKQLTDWYSSVVAQQPNRQEFAKLVMNMCDVARKAADGLYSQAMEITSGDR